MARRGMFAVLPGAVLLSAVLALVGLPAQAATDKPRLDTHTVTIVPPSADPSQPVGCTYQVFSCGVVSVDATFDHLAALSRQNGHFVNTGDLAGSARITRVYGCATASGRRLRGWDTTVVAQTPLDTRYSFGFSLTPDATTLTSTTYAFLRDAQPGGCPTGTRGMTYRVSVDRLVLDLVDLGDDPDTQYHYRIRGSWTWLGAVPTIPVGAGEDARASHTG